jgi:hypothetical protein
MSLRATGGIAEVRLQAKTSFYQRNLLNAAILLAVRVGLQGFCVLPRQCDSEGLTTRRRFLHVRM